MDAAPLQKIAEKVLWSGLALYGMRLRRMGKGYHIQVELDGLNDPVGAVGLIECERFSKAFIEALDEALGRGDFAEGPLEGMDEENYSLEVSSAGAERELRLPQDLERFQGKPLKIRFIDTDGKTRVEHGIFDGFSENGAVRFIGYAPGKKKKGKPRTPDAFMLEMGKIEKVNLFLDV